MFHGNLLESIKTQTIMANASHWLLKTDVYIESFGSISDAKIKFTLYTERSILVKERNCCNDICVQNEIHTTSEIYVPAVILYKLFKYLQFYYKMK